METWIITLSDGGPDAAVSIFVWLLILSGLFHLTGGVTIFTGVQPAKDTVHKRLVVVICYVGIAGFSLLLTNLTLKGFLPLSYVEGLGLTPLRQAIVGIGTTVSTICGFLLLSVYFLSRSKFLSCNTSGDVLVFHRYDLLCICSIHNQPSCMAE